MFDLSLYSVVLLVHIASAIVLVSSALFAPLTRHAVLRAPTLDRLRDWLDFLRRSGRANPPAAMLLLGSGVYLGSAGWWSQPWFYVALGAWAANLLLATRAVKPSAIALARAAASAGDGPVGPDVDRLRRSRRWELGEGIMRGNDVAMLYVMFVKPSAAESLLVVALAGLACIGAEWVLARRMSRLDSPALSASRAQVS
ncbi:MAG: hypothetical protein R6V57_02495 [Vicinamibacterales bacterium]